MTELDLDAFVGPGPEIDIRDPDEPRVADPEPPEPADAAVQAAIEAEKAAHAQLTLEGPEEPVTDAPIARSFLRAMVYVSRTQGEGHVVVLHELAEGRHSVLCNCKASRNLNARPQGCWAMQDARLILGLAEPRRD